MGWLHPVRRALLSASLIVLAVFVFALVTHSKTDQYGSEQQFSKTCCKATDSSECRLKSQPAAPAVCAPVCPDLVALQPEFSAPAMRTVAHPWSDFSVSHSLRAPPAV